ncbi:MAG: carboxypeptidase regulatory-like domain-containing protein, partial [Thermoplasmata archaeon]|nr:carboxypeptidase regulatory-like domain-containing protein [Thermoplasmata archaeon]
MRRVAIIFVTLLFLLPLLFIIPPPLEDAQGAGTLYTVMGYVWDRDGSPVEAPTEVRIVPNVYSPLWENTSSDSGTGFYSVSFDASSPQFYPESEPITVYATAYLPINDNISSSNFAEYGGEFFIWLNLTLPAPHYVKGMVRGTDGQPMEGVRVNATDLDTGSGENVTTSQAGIYTARIYDFNPYADPYDDTYDNLSIEAWYPGGWSSSEILLNPAVDTTWANFTLASDVSMLSTLDRNSLGPGGEVNLTIELENMGNLASSPLDIAISTPLAFEGEELDSASRTSPLHYEAALEANGTASVIIRLSTPVGAVDGATYTINVSVSGEDAASHSLPSMWDEHTIGISKAVMQLAISPRTQELPWAEEAGIDLTITNMGTHKARWLWANATLPAGLDLTNAWSPPQNTVVDGQIVRFTLENVTGSNTLSLSLCLVGPVEDRTHLDIVWAVTFTNATEKAPVSMDLRSTCVVRALVIVANASFPFIVKGDSYIEVEVEIASLTPTVPVFIWANITSMDLVPWGNASMTIMGGTSSGYTGTLYIPYISSAEQAWFTIRVEAAAENGWVAEGVEKDYALLAHYHYVQGNITDRGEAWEGEMTMTNTAIEESIQILAIEGFYRFDLTEMTNTPYPGDGLEIEVDGRTYHLVAVNKDVQWMDISLAPPPIEEYNWYTDPLCML